MDTPLFPDNENDALERDLASAIDGAESLLEIENRLRSLRHVQSVELKDYLLKSNPSQRVFIVEIAPPDGTALTKVVKVFDLGDGRYRFHEQSDR